MSESTEFKYRLPKWLRGKQETVADSIGETESEFVREAVKQRIQKLERDKEEGQPFRSFGQTG